MGDEAPERPDSNRALAIDALGNGRPERATAYALLAVADEVRALRQDLRSAERRAAGRR